MKKFILATLCLSLFMSAVVFAADMMSAAIYATDMNSGARIIKAEFQGVELSTDRQSPTVLERSGDDIIFDIVGNSSCIPLKDVNIVLHSELEVFGGGYGLFDSNGRNYYLIHDPQNILVGNEVIEVYWSINCIIERIDESSAIYETIPGSESPVYYITFNSDSTGGTGGTSGTGGTGDTNYNVPQGTVPAVVRAEFNDVELSKDKNNPTQIPFRNNIKLMGNAAVVSKAINVQQWANGSWTRSGYMVYFNSFAISACSMFAPYDYDNDKFVFNEIIEIEFAVHDENDIEKFASKSPAYYVVFLDEDSSMVDAMVEGIFHTVKLVGDQLIVESKQGYIFDGSEILLKDITENKEYELGIWLDNPDCAGVNSDRIVYSNLPLSKESVYELTIPERAVYSKEGGTYKFNREYITELIMEGALTFSDVNDGDWAQPYINELAEKRIINGYEDGTFRPNYLVTRSEFAKIVYLALQLDKTGDYSGVVVDQPFFVDVFADHWDYIFVKYVGNYMTIYRSSNGDAYFKGNEPAVREDVAVALVRSLGLDKIEGNDYDNTDDNGGDNANNSNNANVNEALKGIFSDYETISPNLRKYVLIAYRQNLINGYPDGTFGAQKPITRAEAAALLIKVLKSDAMEKTVF